METNGCCRDANGCVNVYKGLKAGVTAEVGIAAAVGVAVPYGDCSRPKTRACLGEMIQSAVLQPPSPDC